MHASSRARASGWTCRAGAHARYSACDAAPHERGGRIDAELAQHAATAAA